VWIRIPELVPASHVPQPVNVTLLSASHVLLIASRTQPFSVSFPELSQQTGIVDDIQRAVDLMLSASLSLPLRPSGAGLCGPSLHAGAPSASALTEAKAN